MIKLMKRLLDFSGKERNSLLLSFVFTLVDSVFQMLPILAILTVLTGLLAFADGGAMPAQAIWMSLAVMVISILFFMVVRVDTVWLRIISRIILIPVIAGVSYEVLRLAGRSNSKIMNIVSRPGMWMQGLTTKEPDDSMIEVAIAAVEEVFDWKSYLEENFPEKYPAGYFESEKRQAV